MLLTKLEKLLSQFTRHQWFDSRNAVLIQCQRSQLQLQLVFCHFIAVKLQPGAPLLPCLLIYTAHRDLHFAKVEMTRQAVIIWVGAAARRKVDVHGGNLHHAFFSDVPIMPAATHAQQG